MHLELGIKEIKNRCPTMFWSSIRPKVIWCLPMAYGTGNKFRFPANPATSPVVSYEKTVIREGWRVGVPRSHLSLRLHFCSWETNRAREFKLISIQSENSANRIRKRRVMWLTTAARKAVKFDQPSSYGVNLLGSSNELGQSNLFTLQLGKKILNVKH